MAQLNETEKVSGYYILMQFINMVIFALRRIRINKEYLISFFFIIVAPLFYLIGFKGELKTPVGRLFMKDRITLRSFTYGFLKTRFSYMHILRELLPDISFYPVVVDVGANIGDFTLGVKNIAGKIIAIEPGEENFLALHKTIKVNKLHNVVPLRLAAHDCDENIFLGGNTSDMHVVRDKKGEPVKGMSLDLIMKELGIENIDILKIDVQGHERSVLIGANKLLECKFVKLLIIEVHIHRDVYVKDIISLMKDKGYSLIYRDKYFLSHQPHLYFMPSRTHSRKVN